MTSIFLTATLALIAPQPPAAPAGRANTDAARAANVSLDGTWTVVSFEKNGKPQPEATNYTVTAKGDTITCTAQDGKPAMTWKVSFRPNGQVRVTEQDQQGRSPAARDGRPADTADRLDTNAKAGVYVLTGDYFAVNLHDSNAANNGDRDGRSANSTVKDREQNAPHDNDRDANRADGPTNQSYCSIVLKRQRTATTTDR